jgi:hypothetical protein
LNQRPVLRVREVEREARYHCHRRNLLPDFILAVAPVGAPAKSVFQSSEE